MPINNDENPIRLRFVETVTTKLDGSQQTTGSVIDADSGRAIAGFVGATTQLSASGRVLMLQVDRFGHEVREKKEVVNVADEEPAISN